MTNETIAEHVNIQEIERRARELRAEASRDMAVAVGTWIGNKFSSVFARNRHQAS